MIRRILDWLAPVQPAEPSWLDREDGAGTRWAGCMVLDCTARVSDDTHGWRTCTEHAPASV